MLLPELSLILKLRKIADSTEQKIYIDYDHQTFLALPPAGEYGKKPISADHSVFFKDLVRSLVRDGYLERDPDPDYCHVTLKVRLFWWYILDWSIRMIIVPVIVAVITTLLTILLKS